MPATAAYTQELPNYVKHLVCPHCQMPMKIVRIEGLGLGYDMRTLECLECKREEAVVVKRA
jgi:hypothetical protein